MSRYCFKCGSELTDEQKFCNNCGNANEYIMPTKKKSNPFATIFKILGVILLFVGAYIILYNLPRSEEEKLEKEDICYVTLEEFNQVKHGMTYEEVVSIVGCEGTLSSDYGNSSYNVKMFYWYGKDNISNMVVNFENGKLTGKNQIGLE